MDERDVVTVFLRHGAEVLLLRRSEAVGSYPGRWGAVAGHADGDPGAAAFQEIREETRLEDDEVSLVRRGEPFEVTDTDLDIAWTVHPYLFDVNRRDIATNWETDEAAWVHPTAILTRETVPDLWTSYDRVRPTIETVKSDTVHGSAAISLQALAVLRDEAAMLREREGMGEREQEWRREGEREQEGVREGDREEAWTDIAAIGSAVRDARPEMAAVGNRVDQVMYRAREDRTPGAVHDAAIAVLEDAESADRRAAERAAEFPDGRVVFTLSRSGTVRQALDRANPDRVWVSISRPGAEGREQAAALAEAGHDVVLTSDANIPAGVRSADVVLVGADSVLPSGDIINKVGTTAAMLAARRSGADAYVVCAAAKIRPDGDVELPDGEPADLYTGPADVAVENPVFEVTTGGLVDGIVTERGVLDQEAVEAVAAEFEEYASWVDDLEGGDS